jgi:hypothetical protein
MDTLEEPPARESEARFTISLEKLDWTLRGADPESGSLVQ